LSGSFFSRLEDKLGIHQQPLKERLALASYRLRTLRNKLESKNLMLQQRDKELFDKCIAAKSAGDTARANLYAEECAETRKIAKVILQCEMAIEQVTFKLETAELVGDLAFMMHPIKNVVSMVGQQIQHLMPEVSFELNQINESLDGVVASAGEVTETVSPVGTFSAEADGILKEADALAEQKIKSRFPEIQPVSSTAQRA
jgi:division protein CdvB (Snf7/Vps24/ESCRT-III family)